MSGRFITLEGGEAVGKSTQVQALAAALADRGLDVVTTREPGGSDGAEAIRSLLLAGSADRWSLRSEALLFAAARADHVEKTIRPALSKGRWVLSDRFLDSSLAYQGHAGGQGMDAIRALHRFGSEGFLPDRTLVLMIPEDAARERAVLRDGAIRDRIGGRDDAFHRAVEQGFRVIADAEPDRVRLVDASGTSESVTARLFAQLADLLP